MNYCSDMRTRTPMRVLLTIALTLALLPMLSTFAPGGQVAGFTTASPAVADQIWYQSVGRSSEPAACEKSSTTELAAGWTDWAPSWAKWVNGGKGGFVCNRQITWAFDSVPPSSSGSSSVVTCATGGGAANTCIVGNTGPGGGKVFYVNEANATGSRYLEAAPNTWNGGSADPGIAWCSNTTSLTVGLFGTAIGTGKANTDLMVAGGACTSGAANSAHAYTGGGVSWFLPSKDELNQLYLQKTVVGGFAAVFYWSSSQTDAISAWSQNFDSGNQVFVDKSDTRDVRPVRAF
jgi:hypothetical protein